MYSTLEHTIQNSVATVTLNRPELHHAFNAAMIAELTEVFRSLGKQPDVRAVVLASSGEKSFCAGADLNWMGSMVNYTFEENVQDAQALATMLETIRNCPKPTIARIQGAAFGGGVGLIAACDMAVALKDAKFCLSEVKLGLLPAVISPYVLEKMGSKTYRYALTAERFDAKQAKKLGLIDEKVEDVVELDAWIQERLALLLAAGPEAISACKSLFRQLTSVNTTAEAMPFTTEAIAKRRISAEGQEGMKAFLEKRDASFKTPYASIQSH